MSTRAIGIYNIYGIHNTSQILIKHRENVYPKEGETINDMLVKKYAITDDVYGEIYACNLTDSFLLSTKTLPCLYVNIIYERPMRNCLLYRINLYFTIEDNITSSDQLINSPINGKFFTKIFLNNAEQTIEENISPYPGNEAIYNTFITFTTASEMKEITNSMIIEIQEKFKEMYKDEFSNLQVPENIISLKNYKSE